MGRVCVSSCRCCAVWSVLHPVAIQSAVFCVICSLLLFVSDASGDHMVETYSSMGLIMALYVAIIVSFCFPHVVDVSALSICIVLRALVIVISICLLYVSLGSSVSPSIFGVCAVFCWVWCEESICCLVWVEDEVDCPSSCKYFMYV